jgi:hypothetical protein
VLPTRHCLAPDAASLQRTGIETNEHEDMIAKDAVNPASIDVTFDDIGGAPTELGRRRRRAEAGGWVT